MLRLRDVLSELLSTYVEWHYFVVGLAIGFVAGWVAKAWVARHWRCAS